MAAALKEVMTKTLGKLKKAKFKRFKIKLEDDGQIFKADLEEADIDDTVEQMVDVYSMNAGDTMVKILEKMNLIHVATELKEHLRKESQKDCYPMNSRPRGHCLILNNYIFTHPDYAERKGTGEDAAALRKVFEWLHFTVEEKKDLTGCAMRAVLDDYAKMDHSAYDAVVVCVLSHGQKGSVVGADGVEVSIKDIYRPFTHSTSLVGKPKLFFIQACQGNEFQRGISLQEDGPQEQPGEDFEEDAYNPLFHKASVAIEADIVIGMATVEDCKAFCDIKTGSIYIQALCRALESCCPKKEDLLTILTHVNNEVSKGDFNTHKQMPQPNYTLTKKLVLTVD